MKEITLGEGSQTLGRKRSEKYQVRERCPKSRANPSSFNSDAFDLYG